jgi:eukaryotic-like serine/threonine-protein kinase
MALTAGARLGPYEILSSLGAGGMGEVYKARDTRLDRTVAVKVLPESIASDAQFRERFDREARAISQLQHPHICTLFDVGRQDGTSYLVLQYLEGETLQAHLMKGALPLDQAILYAIQLADALSSAHRAGIVHRDLKPGNIMLTKSGAKLLDFGLAKTGAPAGVAPGVSMLPTTPANLTAQGTILGTFQYMSPEQLEGQEADARTDIFALGAVLYEMVTGRKAFEGKSQASLIAAILSRDPVPLSALSPAVPRALEHVISRCLAKDPNERWQAASDLQQELKWVAENDSSAQAAPTKRSVSSLWMIAVSAFAVLALVALVATALYRSRSSSAPAVARFFVFPPDKNNFASGVPQVTAAVGIISPDGTMLAFTAVDNSGRALLWLRPIDSLKAQPLGGTEGAYLPFWSPDSHWIGFFAGGRLRKIDTLGGPAQTICDVTVGRGGAWGRDGVILFAKATGPIFRVSSSGGEPVAVTRPGPSEASHQFPAFLDDGRHFIFFAQSTTGSSGIDTGSLDSADSTRLLAADTGGVYARPGYLLFVREGTLLAQKFDTGTLRFGGDPFPVGAKVANDFANSPGFSVSDNGVMSYRIGAGNQEGLQLGWYDRSGRTIGLVGGPGNYRGIDLSRDDKRIAAHRHDGTGGDIWVIEAPPGPTSRFTFDASQDNSSPIWSPDGARIAYASRRNGKWGLYLRAAGGGNEEVLLEKETQLVPMGWSPDGRLLMYVAQNQSRDLFALPVAGERTPTPVVSTPFDESHGQVSADGKWIAYESSETSQMEIYVRPFPSGTGKWQISAGGGFWPRWRGDGRELFYVDRTVAGKLMAVSIAVTGATLQPAAPKALFDFSSIGALAHTSVYHTYAVSRDGQRFVFPRPVAGSADETASPIIVVTNWTTAVPK